MSEPDSQHICSFDRLEAKLLQQEQGVETLDLEKLQRAYEYAANKHKGQIRESGEKYVTHCVGVADILSDFYLDTVSLTSCLLHDVVEDTDTDLAEIREQFGEEVARIVDGLTKISKMAYESQGKRQAETYRKLILSMAEDLRAVLVKLADRLHNMRTLEHLSAQRRKRIALETREIYAPLAHRLGMGRIKWELEDLAFKFLEPAEYRHVQRLVGQKRQEREEAIRELREPVAELLEQEGVEAEITGRAKHFWSIWRKMQKRGKPFEEIYDALAIRIIVDDVKECYHTLGLLHNQWTPLSERFNDYIATPKSNMYQSLHTTLFGPGGRLYEVQIRTRQMHQIAEFGVAAHWRYKEESDTDREVDQHLSWFRQVLEWQQETEEPEEFLEFLRVDLFQDEIFVFTPQGDVKELPKGATPVDFAFAIHTEVGMQCRGAKVNGNMVGLNERLESGDTVEILTDNNQTPNRDWLEFVETGKAKQRIRKWVRQQEQEAARELGWEMVQREARSHRETITRPLLGKHLEELGFHDTEDLLAAVGRGEVGAQKVAKTVLGIEDKTSSGTSLRRWVDKVWRRDEKSKLEGLDNMMVRFAQCCQPVPGDDVVGYITQGRGVSVHRRSCQQLQALDDQQERTIEVNWEASSEDRVQVRMKIRGKDRRGLFADLAQAITDTGTNIQATNLESKRDQVEGVLSLEIRDLSHLESVKNAIQWVDGIHQVKRIS